MRVYVFGWIYTVRVQKATMDPHVYTNRNCIISCVRVGA